MNRIDFVYLFDVKDGNPNGDPDAGNLPRVDAQTGQGLVTDVCLKRKVRNYVQITQGDEKILVQSKELSSERVFVNQKIDDAFAELKIDLTKDKDLDGKKRDTKGRAQGKEEEDARKYMCQRFYDVRTFGAVLSTGANAGQVRGPIQLTFARSIDPIYVKENALTVCVARDTEKTFESQTGIQGRKSTVPYGLYVCHGFFSPNLAKQTGFNEQDLELFFEALKNMFDQDHSAARGLMSAQKLIVFEHSSELGNAPASKLFDLVKVDKVTDKPARSFSDYKVTINKENLPSNVDVKELF